MLNRSYKGIIVFLFIIILAVIMYFFTFSSPINYPKNSIITIRDGAGLLEVSDTLKDKNVIRSPFWFRTTAILLGGERGLKAGDYYISNRDNAFRVAWRVVRGIKDVESVKITIPEGFTNKEISNLFDEKFPMFDNDDFLLRAREGYLFPDTYFVEASVTSSSTIKLLESNFNKKIEAYREEIATSTLSFEDLITLASIIEEEAKTAEDRMIIAGIILKRLNQGMPLQVDATLKYVTGRGSSELTKSDLESSSPYNSYVNKGFPPTPISNPGIESILSALHPKQTEFLYFLTDNEGNMHYSKNFEEHKKFKVKYLSN